MTTFLEKVLQKVETLPKDEQDAVAAQILDSIEDEESWKRRFPAKRDQLRQLAAEALTEDERCETRPLDELS